MARTHTSLVNALIQIADAARDNNRPLPVISTDISTAFTLGKIIASDVGCHLMGMSPRGELGRSGVVAIYDGVKIVAPALQTCQHEVDGWREHFGPLADIWS